MGLSSPCIAWMPKENIKKLKKYWGRFADTAHIKIIHYGEWKVITLPDKFGGMPCAEYPL